MKTEDLILELAREADPVQVLAPPAWRAARWIAAATIVVAAMVLLVGVRADLRAMLASPVLVAEGLLGLATTVVAGWTALALVVPGAVTSRAVRAAGLGVALAWLAFVLARLAASGAPLAALAREPDHAICAVSVFALALAPGAFLFVMQRRGAVLQPGWSIGLAALASLAVAAVGVQVHCPISLPTHVLLWHLMPVLAGAAAFALAGSARQATHPRAASAPQV